MKTLHRSLAQAAMSLVSIAAVVCAVPAQQQSAPPSDASASAAVDPKVHDAAMRFVATFGLKQKMAAQIDTLLAQGAENMKSQFPNLVPSSPKNGNRR